METFHGLELASEQTTSYMKVKLNHFPQTQSHYGEGQFQENNEIFGKLFFSADT